MTTRFLAFLLATLAAAPAVAQPAQPAAGHVYELSEVEVLPRPLNAAEFAAALREAYPRSQREAGTGGTVQVSFVVGANGEPAAIEVVSTTDSAFNAPTLLAVSRLRFTPAQVQALPVAVRVMQPVSWRVEGAAAARPAPEVPDSIHVYEADAVAVRPAPADTRGFVAALRELYPQELRREKATARVEVRFAVDPTGQPRYPHVVASSDPAFDAASLEAVQRLRFAPAKNGGAAVWAWMQVPLDWGDARVASSGNAEDGYELSAVEVLPRVANADVFMRSLHRYYPAALRQAGTSGSVQVRFLIDESGTPSRFTITHTSDPAFNQPTLLALRTLRFRPARVNGRPVRVWVEQPIEWSLGAMGASSVYQPPRERMTPPRNPCTTTAC